MIWYPSRLATQDPFTDMEMLQTDVMRFMAILGLCLTAIFALVQTFPQVPVSTPPPVPQATVDPEREAMKRQLAQLQQELSSSRQSLTTAETERAQQLRRQRMDKKQIERLTQRLKSLQLENSAYAKRLKEARAKKIADLQLQVKPPPAPVSTKQPPEAPSSKPKAVDQTKGFVLRFASPEALERLIEDGRVRFLVLNEGRAWAFKLRGGVLDLETAKSPMRFHEMSEETVPVGFRQALATTAADSEGDVIWAVVLPAPLERRLKQLTSDRSGGVIEIQADGTVRVRGKG